MDKLYKELRQHSGTIAYNLFLDLLGSRIEHYRTKNDDAPLNEVPLNQGALRELKELRRYLTFQAKE